MEPLFLMREWQVHPEEDHADGGHFGGHLENLCEKEVAVILMFQFHSARFLFSYVNYSNVSLFKINKVEKYWMSAQIVPSLPVPLAI